MGWSCRRPRVAGKRSRSTVMKLCKSVRSAIAAGCVAFLGALSIPAAASVVIAGTRVIYNASESEVTLKLSNEGQSPALVQSWIDAGDARSAPSAVDVPFTVTPPIARVDASRSQTLRIVYTGEPLPTDRESVFWLNVLEVPPKPSDDTVDANRLQIAFRSRIKLFFRPEHLSGSADGAPAALVWRVTRVNGQPAVEARNSGAFHVSLSEVSVRGGGKVATTDDGGMVGPGETRVFPLKGDLADAPDASVHYRAISDYGGAIDGETPLHPPPAVSP